MNNSILDKASGLLSPQELAAKLRVTRRSVYAWIEKGWLPEPERIGDRMYFDPAAVEQALAKLREDRAAARAERRKSKAPAEVLPTRSPGAS
jgi:excisionase family DNA binding protein